MVEEQKLGPLELAVRSHFPTQPVLYEARALDRELENTHPAWNLLLHGVESFSAHYASVLLHEPAAMIALGRGCLLAVSRAPAIAQKLRAATALLDLLAAVTVEIGREGVDRVDPNMPDQMGKMLASLQQQQDLPFDRGLLLPPLYQIGQQLVMIADEARDPALFYGLLGEINCFLIAISIKRVSFEPMYDGRFEPTKDPERFALSRLEPVRKERIEADLAWLEQLSKDAERASPAVLLELLAYENRNEREEAWNKWFDALCVRAVDLVPEILDRLSQGLQSWILTVQDRPFLLLFAKSIGRLIPKLLSSHGETALDVLLARLGVAIAERLEMEAGRGEVDQALEELLRVGQNLILRKLSLPNQQAADVEALAMRLRSGPVTGQPLSPEDVLFRLSLVEYLEPFATEGFLLGMVCAFCLEEIDFRQAKATSANGRKITQQVVDGMTALLGRNDWSSLVRATRVLLRVAPLSPVAMAGVKSQQRLLALSTREGEASYLVDLRRRIVYRPGPDNIDDVERVLRYWRSGDIDQLHGLADIDSLAALASVQRRDQRIARLINNLADQFCREDQSAVGWLASLPETLYEPESLIKVAGFEELDNESVGLLCNVLAVYRALIQKYRSKHAKNRNEFDNQALLEEADRQLKLRREQNRLLFSEATHDFAQLVSFEKLKRFGDELDLAGDIDVTLEVCSQRCLKLDAKPQQDLAIQILVRMVEQAKMSGHLAGLSFDANTPFNKGTLLLLRETLETERTNLIDELRPFVQDSIRRIQHNPLASFSASYKQHVFGEGWKNSADTLVVALVDDLLATDGGILHLSRFVKQLEAEL